MSDGLKLLYKRPGTCPVSLELSTETSVLKEKESQDVLLSLRLKGVVFFVHPIDDSLRVATSNVKLLFDIGESGVRRWTGN